MKSWLDQKNIQFTLIYIVIVISFFDNFSQIPVMATFAKSLGASIFLASLIVSAYSMSNMLGNFYSGFLTDRFGRTLCMSYGLVFSGIAVLTYAFVSTPSQLFLVRTLHGLGIAVVIPAAFTLVGDLSLSSSRGRNMAMSGIAISIAALLGPPIGGLVKTFLGLNFLFIGSAVLLFIGAALCKFLINETYTEEFKELDVNLSKTRVNFFRPELIIAYLGALLLMVAKGTLVFSLPLHAQELGFSSATTGILFSSFAISAIIIFATPFNRLSDRKGRFIPIISGLSTISLALALLGLGNNLLELVPIMLLYGVGFGMLFPACTALIVDSSDIQDRGKVFGIFYGVFSLGVVIGPITAGALAEWINPFHTASVIVVLGLIPIGALFRKIKGKEILLKS